MNSATFDEWGRMTANLGLEAPGATPLLQNIILYPYVNPATEVLDATSQSVGLSLNVTPLSAATANGTQIWKITHNGVDTHPIHFHLYDVQVINRVTWDNIIIPPDPTELGWKDTVRISPLEDTIVAVRPIVPALPFGLLDSKRVLNPMMPLHAKGSNVGLGQEAGFSNINALGNALAIPVANEITDFGWEYVFHCHILSHEEMDMMRPVIVHVGRDFPDAPVLSFTGSSGADVKLFWTDGTPVNYLDPTTWGSIKGEVGYRIERRELGGVFAPIAAGMANQINYTDPTTLFMTTYDYRVVAFNAAGNSTSNMITVGPDPVAAPSGLVATPVGVSQINLSWVDNSGGEDEFIIQRCTPGVCVPVAEVGSTLAPNVTTYQDTGLSANTAYSYQVFARSAIYFDGLPSNVATATTLASLPAAPSGLTATVVGTSQVNLAWTDNATDETGFVVERAVDGGAFTTLATLGANVTVYNNNTAVSVGHTYDYQVKAVRLVDSSAFSNIATAIVIAAPSTLVATPINAGQVNLTWADNSTNETGFSIERCTGVGCTTFAQIGTAAANAVAYSDLTTAPITTYIYRVIATSSAPVGQSLPSNTVSAITQDLIPVAPTALIATVVSASQVDLGWTDNSLNEVSFVVERAVDGGAFATLATLGANVTAYSDITVAVDHTYDYRVMATNTGGASGYTNTATAIIIAAPSTLVATPINAGQVDLTWADTSANETGFSIERCTGAACTTFAQIGTVAAGVVAYSDLTTAPITNYVYRVIATSSAPVGQSLPSNTAAALTQDLIPVAPTLLTATVVGASQVDLSWSDNSLNEVTLWWNAQSMAEPSQPSRPWAPM